jgi:hypothetical protein
MLMAKSGVGNCRKQAIPLKTPSAEVNEQIGGEAAKKN